MDQAVDLQSYMRGLGTRARAASRKLAACSSAQRSDALLTIANKLEDSVDALLEANAKDVANGEANGLAPALQDRLALNPARIATMAAGLREIAALPDPIGEITELRYRPTYRWSHACRWAWWASLRIEAECDGRCGSVLKSGNATILRGGSEAWNQGSTASARTAGSRAGGDAVGC